MFLLLSLQGVVLGSRHSYSRQSSVCPPFFLVPGDILSHLDNVVRLIRTPIPPPAERNLTFSFVTSAPLFLGLPFGVHRPCISLSLSLLPSPLSFSLRASLLFVYPSVMSVLFSLCPFLSPSASLPLLCVLCFSLVSRSLSPSCVSPLLWAAYVNTSARHDTQRYTHERTNGTNTRARTQARGGPVDAPLHRRRQDDPLRCEDLPIAGAFRRGLQRVLQVQQEAARGLPQHHQLPPRPVPDLPGGLRVHHGNGPHPGAHGLQYSRIQQSIDSEAVGRKGYPTSLDYSASFYRQQQTAYTRVCACVCVCVFFFQS